MAASASRRFRVEVSKNSSTAASSNDGEFETSTTTSAPSRTSRTPSPVSVFTPEFATAQTHTPLIVALDQADSAIYGQECFGPVSYLVATDSGAASLKVAQTTLREQGALTLGIYSTDRTTIDQAVALARRGRVALSINLTQGVFVNQSAAFSDYHATGGNPAANASYTSLAFVADRFVIVQRREHVAAPG